MSLKRLQDTESIYGNQLYFYILAPINQQLKGRAISFSVVSLDNMKYLGIYLTTDMQISYTANYKTMLREIKEDLN